jgi:hypothetical protein
MDRQEDKKTAMRAPGRRSTGVFAITVLFLASAVSASAATPRPRLEGAWKLNPELTARLSKDQQQGDGQAADDSAKHRHPNGTASTGPLGNTSPGGSFGRAPEPEDNALGAGGMAPLPKRDPSRSEIMAALDRLVIAQQEGQVTIIDRGGRPRILKTNGTKIRDEASPNGPAWLRASWDRDDALVVEVRPATGSKRTETYVVSNDHKHLYVTVVTGMESPVLLAFDQADAATEATTPTPEATGTAATTPGGAPPPAAGAAPSTGATPPAAASPVPPPANKPPASTVPPPAPRADR